MKLSDLLTFKGVRGPGLLQRCDPDGSFAGIQGDATTPCYDKYDNVINEHKPSGGGCQCARDIQLFKDNNILLDIQCRVSTGIYDTKQQRDGLAFCVDDDGIRSGPLVFVQYIEYLGCNSSMKCQNGNNDICDGACSGCSNDAYYYYQAEQTYFKYK
nr:uncharacterized protein LOC128703592 [Cherax quadricarinatus]